MEYKKRGGRAGKVGGGEGQKLNIVPKLFNSFIQLTLFLIGLMD